MSTKLSRRSILTGALALSAGTAMTASGLVVPAHAYSGTVPSDFRVSIYPDSAPLEIRAGQHLLRQWGYSCSTTGVWDAATTTAAKRATADHGFTRYPGCLGYALIHKLLWTRQQGHSGHMVSALQCLLNLRLPARLNLQGVYGSATVGCVKSFQAKVGLTQTGVVDRPTWKALLAAPRGSKPTPSTHLVAVNQMETGLAASKNCGPSSGVIAAASLGFNVPYYVAVPNGNEKAVQNMRKLCGLAQYDSTDFHDLEQGFTALKVPHRRSDDKTEALNAAESGKVVVWMVWFDKLVQNFTPENHVPHMIVLRGKNSQGQIHVSDPIPSYRGGDPHLRWYSRSHLLNASHANRRYGLIVG